MHRLRGRARRALETFLHRTGHGFDEKTGVVTGLALGVSHSCYSAVSDSNLTSDDSVRYGSIIALYTAGLFLYGSLNQHCINPLIAKAKRKFQCRMALYHARKHCLEPTEEEMKEPRFYD